MKISCVAAVALSCLLPVTVNAALITKDLITAGDKLATYDDITGNLWVKSSYTKNLKYGQVLDSIDTPGSPLSGFQLADETQVNALMDEYAFPGGGSGIPWSIEGASIFYETLVATDVVPAATGTRAWSISGMGLAREPNLLAGSYFSFYKVSISDTGFPFPQVNWTDYGTNDITSPDPRELFGFSGFFLVKHVPEVPVPGSVGLLASAIVSLVVAQHKKKRAVSSRY